MTTWKPVPGWEDLYHVSDDGQIKRLKSVVRNGSGLVTRQERLVKPTLSNGYYVANLWRDNSPKRWLTHRLVALAFIGPSDLSIDHINGDGKDNRLENLRYCTLRDNTLFQHADGRVIFVRGESNGKSKLTVDQVISAKKDMAQGISLSKIAASLGVSKGTIAAISTGRTWAHVKLEAA